MMVDNRYPDRRIPVEKFKIQFARMGEPALNDSVLEVLDTIPSRYDAPGLLISFSTVAPQGREPFFNALHEVKNRHYRKRFQFQYSIHSTDEKYRNWLIPYPVLSFSEMANFGTRFHENGDKKITLNFALARNTPLEPGILIKYFDPEIFLVKITPVNPTGQAARNQLENSIFPNTAPDIMTDLQKLGYQVILSVGELEENQIGSNCGQFLSKYKENPQQIVDGYSYQVQRTS